MTLTADELLITNDVFMKEVLSSHKVICDFKCIFESTSQTMSFIPRLLYK